MTVLPPTPFGPAVHEAVPKTGVDQDQPPQQAVALSDAERRQIADAVDAGARQYFGERRERVTQFVTEHYSFRGSLRLHRHALGLDLLRAPANVLWAVPYLGVNLSRAALHRSGARRLAAALQRLRPGFQTAVQREVLRLVQEELLGLPAGHRVGGPDALAAAVLSQPTVAGAIERYLASIRVRAEDPAFRRALTADLASYAVTRAAASDLVCAALTTTSGALAFGKLTPGALSAGPALAALLAQQAAVSQFLLGPTLGAWYYGVIPATASAGLIAASTGGVATGLALFAAFAGLAADPLQARMGIHRRRLLRLIDALEQRFFGVARHGFRPRDQYLARVFDLIDVLRGAAALR
ncbi:MAG: DUF6635 family protein [Chromatiaceae bacterium]